MNHFLKQHLYVVYSVILLMYIANTFIGSESIHYVIGILAIPMLLISLLGASKLFRILGSIFIAVGTGMYIYSGLPLYQVPLYFTSTMPLLAFFIVLPWMNSIVRAGRFDRRINELMKANVSDLGKLYVRSSFTTYTLCSFINLSALSISQEVLLENMAKMKKKIKDSFISQTTLRAFAVALCWSPMEIMVAMTVDATGVSYLAYLPWLILCSFIVLMVDWLWGSRRFKSVPYEAAVYHPERTIEPGIIAWKITKLVIALTAFLLIVVTLGNAYNLNFILSVTLVILPFSFCWALVMNRMRSFLAIGWGTWKFRTNHMQNFVVLFLSLAFFSSSLNETPFLGMIQQPFLAASETPLVILLLIQGTYLLMSMIGVHPVATIGILAEVMQPLYSVINPMSVGMVLITGALATATVGAYGITVTMTSMNTVQNPYRITLRNMPFAIFYGGVGTLIGYLLL
ncbi:hypothetical protein PQ478_12305 [Alkalihalophilus pseudofirmus]|uniref:hypothetical protein n=1 Tax=Alkalihalophilus pseudofirmus TaxID=79885 RepID=UPI00259BACDA|nr:hypothetical protein [Alkalihalophilus pseudofirmus]WEG15322.1 hypothetical protein PQ478_12305 [Alkalihalophilus pseudofirmus]